MKRAEAARAGAAPDARPHDVARRLLAWYDAHRRDLPWRRERSPYRTLVSELMLQQTVVATVIPYFGRFLARFPDVHALAAASEDDVLASWSGLGYYARGRNLHRAARAVVDRHGGALPADEESLRALPGVGPYTAAAVAAIAFGRRALALDGNTARVLARLANVTAPVDQPAVRRDLAAFGLSCVPADRPGDFAEALMDLGATVCGPRAPACDACPLASSCQARRHGTMAAIPRKKPKASRPIVQVASVRLRRGDRLMMVRRQEGLLAGTWTLPACEFAEGREAADAAAEALRAIGGRAGEPAGPLSLVGRIRHVFTHRDVTATVFEVRGSAPAASGRRWVDLADLPGLAVSSFVRKQLLLGAGEPRPRPPRQRARTAVERSP